jgi:hypothetical protein
MITSVPSALSYALWPLLTFAIVALWLAAMLGIQSHIRKASSTNAESLLMAVIVSIVAVIAVIVTSAVFPARWIGSVPEDAANEMQANERRCDAPVRAYVFSFGLEHASPSTSLCVRSTKEG